MNGSLLTVLPSSNALLLALLVTLVFATVAWWIHGVDRSGAIAGGVICFVLFTGAGPGAFAGLVAVFILAWASTRVGYRRKQEQGTAERKTGRKASQVLANLGVAAGCAALHFAHSRFVPSGVEIFSLGMVAAFSEAAADTVSSAPDYHLESGSAGHRRRRQSARHARGSTRRRIGSRNLFSG